MQSRAGKINSVIYIVATILLLNHVDCCILFLPGTGKPGFKVAGSLVKGAMSWFRHFEELSLSFSSLFAICVYLLHP